MNRAPGSLPQIRQSAIDLHCLDVSITVMVGSLERCHLCLLLLRTCQVYGVGESANQNAALPMASLGRAEGLLRPSNRKAEDWTILRDS